ncbi:hypothetical protein CSPAE12_03054, partial [Colletotrichum incanum]
AAIKAYRSHIAGNNRRILEVYVPLIATTEPNPDDLEEDEDINELRIQSLESIFDLRLKDFVSTPGNVPTRWDELVSVYDLDGTKGHPPKADRAHREKQFSLLDEALKRVCLEEVRESIAVPEEFRILAEHVETLSAPGLGVELKSRYQAYFCLGSAMMKRLPRCQRLPRRWECAAGWEPGYGYECYFYVVYCRLSGSSEPWAWRYISMDPMNVGMFDTIPELLAWYCRYREKPVPEASGLRGEDFLNGDVF